MTGLHDRVPAASGRARAGNFAPQVGLVVGSGPNNENAFEPPDRPSQPVRPSRILEVIR